MHISVNIIEFISLSVYILYIMFLNIKNQIVTVHSVHSNVAKIHSRLPAAMEFWLVCPAKQLFGYEQVAKRIANIRLTFHLQFLTDTWQYKNRNAQCEFTQLL